MRTIGIYVYTTTDAIQCDFTLTESRVDFEINYDCRCMLFISASRSTVDAGDQGRRQVAPVGRTASDVNATHIRDRLRRVNNFTTAEGAMESGRQRYSRDGGPAAADAQRVGRGSYGTTTGGLLVLGPSR